MSDCNDIFPKVQLGQLSINKGEYGANAPALAYNPDLPRYVRITDIDDKGRLIPGSNASIEWRAAKPYLLANGDLLLARTGSVGRSYLYNESDGICAHAGYLIRFRLDSSKCNFQYVSQWARSDHFLQQVYRTTRQTVQGNINATEYGLFLVPCPEIKVQEEIAQILDTIDEAIQRTEQLIAKLKAIKQGLLHDLLTRGIDENGQLRDPIAHPEQFKDSPLGRIPKAWEVYSVKDIGKIVAGTTPSRSVASYWGGTIPWITPTDMSNLKTDYISRGADYITKKGLESCSAYLLPPGSIVVTTRATLGLAAITECELATNQGFKNIILNDGWDRRFICYKIRTLSKEMVKRASGTTFLEISGKQFSLLGFASPPPGSTEQAFIADKIVAHNHKITGEENYLDKLKLIKKGLMHDLLTGKVRVNINKGEYEHEDIYHT